MRKYTKKEKWQSEDSILHVSEVKGYLKQTAHLSFVEEVEYGVEEYIACCRPGWAEGHPLPMVILCIQDEVHSYDSSAHCHHAQDGIHQKHESVHIVELIRPESCEDKVHLDKNWTEGQDASSRDDEVRVRVPSSEGDRPEIPE